MATAPSPEASEIRRRGRRRLLGAVTLVMALVVFVPMILDNEPRPSRSQPSLAIPSKEEAAPLPAPAPAVTAVAATATPPSDKAPISASGEVPPTAAPAQPAKVEPAPPSSRAPQGAEPSSRAPQGAAAPSSRAPQGGNGPGPNPQAPPKLQGFAVQVGAFREEERLKQARAKLEGAGVPHYTERIDGGLTRLRAGPFRTREAAEAARAKLSDGKVVSLP